MDSAEQENQEKVLPFNNLYLITGLVSGLNHVWMYLLTLSLLISGYVAFQSVILFPLMAILLKNGYTQEAILENAGLLFDSKALQMDMNLLLLLELGMFVFAFIGFFIGLKYFHRKSLVSVLTGFEKFRFKHFWFAFAVWALLLIALVIGEYFFFSGDLKLNFQWQGFLISCLIMILLMPIQTGLEEIIFRGYLVQGLSQITRNGFVPIIITSVLFGTAHLGNPEVKEYGTGIMLAYYIAFALFMGAVTLLDEGLELAFGIHFANNLISSLLVSSEHSVIKTYAVFQSSGEDPYKEIFVWLGMAVLSFAMFWYKFRWKNLNLLIK